MQIKRAIILWCIKVESQPPKQNPALLCFVWKSTLNGRKRFSKTFLPADYFMSQQNSTRFWVFDLTFIHDCLKFENRIYKKSSRPLCISWHGQKFMQTKLKILSKGQLINICVDILVQTMTPKRHFEINGPLPLSQNIFRIVPALK